MKIVLQRVSRAEVRVSEKIIGKIEKGLLLLVGIANEDNEQICDMMIDKIINLRIFEDSDGKMNLSLLDVHGELLVISQFTLYADCKGGRRPSFIGAAKRDIARPLYSKFLQKCSDRGVVTAQGEFGADMKVDFINDGPVTIILDSAVL